MRKNRAWMWFAAAFLVFAQAALADVTLPAIFSSGMVLQQKSTVTIWGWAQPGEKIDAKGSWMWFGTGTRADQDGKWSLRVRTSKAGGPHTLTIKGDNEIVLDDLLFGEVWVCSGQSNMEYTMSMLQDATINADIAKADYPQMRLFTVKKAMATEPQKDVEGSWQVCTPDVVKNFSATAFYFGRKLHQDLNVPVGLVSTNWGGTKSEAWTSRETLVKYDQFRETVEALSIPENSAARENKTRQAVQAWEEKIAKLDKGMEEGWYRPDYDDSEWKEMDLPKKWSETDLADVDGIVWFRRTTNLPPSWTRGDMELHLGPIDDEATVWFNGVPLGSTFGWDQKRVYRIPKAALRVGKNSIAVRVVDDRSEGGMWGSEEDMRIGPPGADVKAAATVAKTWKYKVSYDGGKLPAVPDTGALNPNMPTVLYNAMIAPIVPLKIAGAIWYQGESNCYDPILYRDIFPAMITDWREKWGQGDFPFYYVQIAPYEYGAGTQSQAIREAQMMTLDAVDNVGMAVTMDIGMERDIHPKNKWDVGDRLARWALAKDYGKKDIVYSGPIYKEMKVERDTIRLSFDYTDGGLIAKGGPLIDFMIAGEDRKFVPAKAVIEGDTIVVSCSEVKNPAAVRYAWSNWACPNLFNGAGLPASSFRTDDWPL